MCVCEGGVPTSAQIKDSIHEDRAAIWQGPHNPTPGGFTEEGPRLSLPTVPEFRRANMGAELRVGRF